MAVQVVLSAKLNLSGPYNLKPVISSINRQLRGITANVNVKLDKNSITGINNVNKALQGLNSTLSKVSTNAASAAASIGAIANSLRGANTTVSNINAINKGMTSVTRSTRIATSDMQTFGKEAGLAIKRAGAFTIATGAIFGLVRAISSGVSAAIEFERGMVKLSQVTGVSVKGLADLNNEIGRLSTGFGVSSASLLEVAKTLAQAGLNARDVKTALEAIAKSALAPSFDDIANTTEGLIAIMGQFRNELTGVGIEAKDFEKVLGSINAVSNAFAVEADDIVAAIRRMGGVFAAASDEFGDPVHQLNELMAVFTSVRATTRESAETIATGLRTIFTRLQRPDTIEFLREFGIELSTMEGKFVGPYEAIRRLSEALQGISRQDLRFARITEELGGIRQVGKLIPAIKEFNTAERALGVAQQGATSLTEQATIAQQSLANQIDKTREKFLKLIRDISNTQSFQTFARVSLAVGDSLIKIADATKELIPLLGLLFAGKSLRAANEFFTGFVGAFRPGGGFGSVASSRPLRRAGGGFVPGVGNSDTVPAMLTPGEYVIRKQAVKQLGVENLHRINGYANGGLVRKYNGGSPGGVEYFSDEEEKLHNLMKAAKVLPSMERDKAIKKAAAYDLRKGTSLAGALGSVTQAHFDAFQSRRKGAAKNKVIDDREPLKTLILDGSTLGFGMAALNPKETTDHIQKAYTRTVGKGLPKGIQAVAGNIPVFYINSQKRELLSPAIDDGVNNIIHQGNNILGGSSLSGDNIEAIRKRIQTQSLNGIIFEGILAAFGRTFKEKQGGAAGNFDFVGKETNKLQKLWSEGPPLPEYLEAKIEDNRKSRIDTLMKAVRAGKTAGTIRDISEADLKARKFATGGNVDTVPALLTPGEYVINKQAASRLGLATLNKMNRGGFARFANGGLVQNFQDGGGVESGDIPANTATFGRRVYRQFEKVFQGFTKDSIELRVAIDGYVKGLKDTKGELFRLQQELKEGTITQDQFNAATKQRKLDAVQAGKNRVKDFRRGIPQEASLAGLITDQNLIRPTDTGMMHGPMENPSLAARTRRGFANSSIARGFGSLRASYLGTQEQQDSRALRNQRIQQTGFGLLLAAGAIEQALPTPTSAGGARFKGGLSGAAAGAGIGAQFGGGIGMAIGGLVGAIEGANRAYFEFLNSKALERIKEASQGVVKAFEDLTTNIPGKTAGQKETQALIHAASLMQDAAEADISNEAKNYSGLGAITNASIRGLSIFGGLDNPNQMFRAQTEADIVAAMQTRRDVSKETIAPALSKNILEGRISRQKLGDSGFRALALAEGGLLEKITKEVTSDKNFEGREQAEDEVGRRLVEAGKGLSEKLFKQSAEYQQAQKDIANRSRAAAEAIEFFSNNLKKADEVLSRIPTILARADSQIESAVSRVGGGRGSNRIIGDNVFTRPLTSSAGDFNRGFKDISRTTGDTQEIRGFADMVKKTQDLTKALPGIIQELEKPDVNSGGSKRLALGVRLKEFGLPAEIQEKLLSLADATDKGSQELLASLQGALIPITEEAAKVYEQSIAIQQDYANKLQSVNNAIRQSEDKLFAAKQEIESSLIGIGERDSGTVNVRGRFGMQDAAVARLTDGITDTASIEAKALKVREELEKLEGLGSVGNIEKREKLENKLADLTEALEINSKNTVKLAAVNARMQELEQKRSAGINVAGRLATAKPEEMAAMVRGLGAAARFRATGVLPGTRMEREALMSGIGEVKALFPKVGEELEDKLLKAIPGLMGVFGEDILAEREKAKAEEKRLHEDSLRGAEALKALADAGLSGKLDAAAAAQAAAAEAMNNAIRVMLGRGGVPGAAGGGLITGPGTTTSDSIAARLSNGEFVMRADAVRRYGLGFMQTINKGKAPGFAAGGLVTGGGITINSDALGALNNFGGAAARLSQSIDNLRIPENITMTGTHEHFVHITGAEALAQMPQAIQELVDGKIAEAIRKHIPLQQRMENAQ